MLWIVLVSFHPSRHCLAELERKRFQLWSLEIGRWLKSDIKATFHCLWVFYWMSLLHLSAGSETSQREGSTVVLNLKVRSSKRVMVWFSSSGKAGFEFDLLFKYQSGLSCSNLLAKCWKGWKYEWQWGKEAKQLFSSLNSVMKHQPQTYTN